MKTYARIRTDHNLECRKHGKIKILNQTLAHPTYFEVKQPDKLDNNIFNVIIVGPLSLKGHRVRSIDLEFFTEEELKKELI